MEGCPVIFTAGKFTMSLLYATAFTLLRLFFLMGEVAMGARRCCCCCLERSGGVKFHCLLFVVCCELSCGCTVGRHEILLGAFRSAIWVGEFSFRRLLNYVTDQVVLLIIYPLYPSFQRNNPLLSTNAGVHSRPRYHTKQNICYMLSSLALWNLLFLQKRFFIFQSKRDWANLPVSYIFVDALLSSLQGVELDRMYRIRW
jgi:hypothetical protein